MSTSLILHDPRSVPGEPGAAFHYEFGSRRRELSGDGQLDLTQVYRDPLAGHYMSLPSFDLTSMDAADWATDGGTWVAPEAQPAPFYRVADGTWAAGLAQREPDADWSLTQRTAAACGEPRFVKFITYDSAADEADAVLTLRFGGVWQVALERGGSAALARLGTAGYETVARFDWRRGGDWAPGVHWLWVYEVGGKLVLRNVDGAGGLVYHDPSPALDRGGRPHALRAGAWTLAGSGPLVVVCCPQRFVAGRSSLALRTPADIGWPGEGSTQPVQVRLHALATSSAAEARVAVWDQDAADWPESPSPAFTPGKTALGWRVEWTSDGRDTSFVGGLDLLLPGTRGSDGQTGVDLLSLDGVAARSLVLSRDADQLHQRLSVELQTWQVPLAAWVQPNVRLRYAVAGVTRFVGDTGSASWTTTADTQPVSGVLKLSASGLWQRLARTRWPGGLPFDGRRLTDCLAEVFAAALAPDEFSVVNDPFELPATADGEPPAWVFRPGVRLDRIVGALRERFFGTRLTLFQRPSDGRLVVDYSGTGAVVARFYETTALAAAAGEPEQVLLHGSYSETLDQAGLANVVTVIGRDPDGAPLLARAVDYASLRDRTAFNYVGEVWPKTVIESALSTQSAVNLACRSLFEQCRWPSVHARWRSVRLDLWPGQVVELVGPNHGTRVVLRGLQLDEGATDPLGHATYTAEVLR